MYKNLKIGSRLIIAFLIMSVLVGGVSIFSIIELRKVLKPLTDDIPAGLKEIETTSHLDALAQRIRYYDQLLTESARYYAKTGNKKWKYRYKNIEPILGDVIREAIQKGDPEDKRIFSEIDRAKRAYVDLEYQALDAVDEGERQRAVAILESPVYWQQKEEYKAGLEKYVERRGKKHGETLEVTSTKVDAIVQQTHALVQESIKLLMTVSFFGVLLAVILGVFVARSILTPIKALQRGVEIIGKGNLHYKIRLPSKDEIGHFAEAFNEMTRKLKDSYAGLEDKVKEKTAELARKVEQIERQNRELEDSKKTILKVVQDLEIAKAKIEQEKVESEALLESIGEGMIATDQHGHIMMINQQIEIMFGWSPAEAEGRLFAEIFPAEDEKGRPVPVGERPIFQTLTSGRKTVTTTYYVRRDRTKFPAAVTVSPIRLEGKTIGAIEIIRDITKEKEVDRMKNEFISTVSHELRTPLTVIREGVSLVTDGILGPINEKQSRFLRVALGDIDRLKRIIDNLLDISKIEAGKMELKRENVNLTEIVKGILSSFETRAKTKNLELRGVFSSDEIPAYVDRDKIIQVFTNLIGNAFKFTEKGSIEVSVQDRAQEGVLCHVADTGKGISAEDLPKVFGKFQQFARTDGAGEKGTGLGLSIAKGIVELHQGKIWVESAVNEGTKFIFTLPRVTAQDLLKQQVACFLQEAKEQKLSLSVLTLQMEDYVGIQKRLGTEKLNSLKGQLQSIARACLRRHLDTTFLTRDTLYVVLPGTTKTDASAVADRIQTSLNEFLTKEELSTFVKISSKVITYPEDVNDEEALLQLAA